MDKNSPSKYSFSDIWVLWWKFNRFLMSFLELQGQVLFKFCISVQCHERQLITDVQFCSSNFTYFEQKEPIEKKFSVFFLFFFFKPCITFKCNERKLYRTFSAETLYDLDKKNPLNSKILDFQLLTWNFTKLLLW